MKKYGIVFLCLFMLFLSGCKQNASAGTKQDAEEKAGTRDAAAQVLEPEASGETIYEAEGVILDASNAADGYFMVKYTGDVPKVRVQVTAPDGTKNQPLLTIDGDYKTFPLAGGDGIYQIHILENTTGSSYAVLLSVTLEVTLTDAYRPFLYPNQYVDYNRNSAAVKKGEELAEGADSDLEVIEKIYSYVTENIVYDNEKAARVKDGYAPAVDETLSSGKGICFDYAALMTAMMRTQRIPTRLDIGYAGEVKHAWISAYTPETGWIDKVIAFDGSTWTLMDPTFAASAKKKERSSYVGDGTNYTLQYSY